jgi:hypothetical protein
MTFYEVDPLQDPRWPELLERDSRSSVFHTCQWLRALRRTYGFESVVLTTTEPNTELTDGILLTRINSWLTGRRLVSVPFSDHCQPLMDDLAQSQELNRYLADSVRAERLKYVEFRPRTSWNGANFASQATETFALHAIDLRPSSEELFQSLHKDSIRRKIQRAEREKVSYVRGNDKKLLEDFYFLFVMTRKKHGLPPSPKSWFQNLLAEFGSAAQIRIVYKDETPIAGLLTLSYKQTVVYKYGGSDPTQTAIGGTPYLFWKTILESKNEGMEEIDLGRSDLDNDGLITFKTRLGGKRSELTYWRFPTSDSTKLQDRRGFHIAQKLIKYVPDPVRIRVGNLLYRHFG